MIQYKNMPLYSRKVSGMRFYKKDKPYLLVYFPENSLFINDYPKLNIKFQDFKTVIVPTTKIPRSRMTPEIHKLYKMRKLQSYASNMKFPSNRNLIYDLSFYFKTIDQVYHPQTYRQRAGFLIKNIITKIFTDFPGYEKILLYTVDVTKELDIIINRKIFPIVQQIKTREHPFSDMLLGTIGISKTMYRVLMKDGDFNFTRTYAFLKSIRPIETEEEDDKETKDAAEKIVNKVKDNLSIADKNRKEKVINAVYNYLKKDDKMLSKILANKETENEIKDTVIKSVLYSSTGNINKARNIAKSIPPSKKNKALKLIDKQYVDMILSKSKPINMSSDPIISLVNIPEMVDNKAPNHIFEKRQIDFEQNLSKDIERSFKILQGKEVSLKVSKVRIEEKPQKKGELEKSDVNIVNIELKDMFGNTHDVKIEIPKIDPQTGTFRINGRKKCLINQIVVCPISFPKLYDSKFESSYSSFHIWSKRTKRLKYLEAYMGSYKLPLFILLAYSFGFDETCKKYKIDYEITNEKPKRKQKYSVKINNEKYILFKNVDSELKEELCQSFIQAKVSEYDISKEFGTKEYFNELIISMTGRVNSTFLISSNLENIVDPVAKQVLINQQLPYELENIMEYMITKLLTGFCQERNDLSNQRIRNSEVLVHLIQKQILAAYTNYKEQVLSGNTDAKFEFSPTKVLSEFSMLEIVTDMEYANPVEEMATITRISPVGKKVSGIPDKVAIQIDARNVHDSYFGTIDPFDTPEGENIGIVQQLTIDAALTSARGLIKTKQINNKEASGLLSTSAALIPFIENNDGARIIMATQQAKQVIPLKNPSPPVIQSGYESILPQVLSDSFIKKAPCNGKVTQVENDFIEVKCPKGTTKVSLMPEHLKSGSGKNTLSVFNPIVKIGQSVKTNQVLAEGSCISNGSISLGRTLLTGYMPYKGYNFEDGIAISSKLVENDFLTSLHGIEEEILISKKDRIISIANIGDKTKKGDRLLVKTIGEIEELIGYQEIEDEEGTEIIGGQLILKSPGGTIVDIEVFSNLDENKFPKLKDLIDRTNKRYNKPKKEKFTIKSVPIKGVLIKFKIEQELKINVGDKLCNRYGNKGIISVIEDEKNMPRTPWGDHLEIVLNPIGILGRMNMGQVFELYSGLISKRIGDMFLSNESKSKILTVLNKVLSILDSTKDKQYSTKLISTFKSLSDTKFKKIIEDVKNTGFFPLVIPPFKSPSHSQIMEAMKILNLKSGYPLYLPEYNVKTKNEVPVGYTYIYKLEHIAAEKIHGRATGPVTGKLLQPTAGKRREGGQRLGEGDTYSLISYSALSVLSELMGPLSDDHLTKNEILSQVIQKGHADYIEPKSSPAKDLLNSYFISLMLERK